MLDKTLANRVQLSEAYKTNLGKLEGIKFQSITPECSTTYKDFSIYIEPDKFGLNRDQLCEALSKENIMAKKYFYPPLHRQRAYSQFFDEYKDKLPVTDDISTHVLSLPLFSHMEVVDVVKVCEAIKRIQENAEDIKAKLK